MPGLRNIKTAVSVVICAITINILNHFIEPTHIEITYFYAAIAAVFTLSQTIDHSIKRGKGRITGTIIGSMVALFVGVVRINIFNNSLEMFFLFIAIVLSIFLVNKLTTQDGIMIACIMVIASFTTQESHYTLYVTLRTLETIYGVGVAILVNKYLFPYKASE